MSLVIEDGTGLSTATSYVTVTEARAYALARGVTLSATDSVVETQCRNAWDYINAQEERLQGYRTWPPTMGEYDHEQSGAFPRTGMILYGYGIDSDKIPQMVKDVSCQLCIEQQAGVELFPTGTGNGIKSEKVDVIEVEYATYSTAASPRMRKVDALLRPLFNYGGSITARRVL